MVRKWAIRGFEDQLFLFRIDIPRKRKLADIVETTEEKDGKLASDAYKDRLKKRFDRAANVTAATLATPSWADLTQKKRRKRKTSTGM